MNRNFLCSLGLLLAIVGTSQQLVATSATARRNNVPNEKPSSVSTKKKAKKANQLAAMVAPKIMGAEHRQALIERRRAEIRAMLKKQGKGEFLKKVFQKGAKRKRTGQPMRPWVRRRQYKAKSLAEDLAATPGYARFVPDPDFGKPHRVNLAAATAVNKQSVKKNKVQK